MKDVLYFGDIPLHQQQGGINLKAPELFDSLKNPYMKDSFLHKSRTVNSEQWVRDLANNTKMTDSCNYQTVRAELIGDRIMTGQKSRHSNANA